MTVDVILFTDVNGWLGFSRYAGTYKVASELRRAGFSVQTVDFFSDYSEEELSSIVRKYVGPGTLFAGFSTTLWTRKFDWRNYVFNSFEEHLRDLFPRTPESISNLFISLKDAGVKIVVGGAKAENRSDPRVDYWVHGQADVSAVALAKHLRDGTPLQNKEGRIFGHDYTYHGFAQSSIDWHPSDHVFHGESLPVEIARGCIFRCAFCHYPMNGKKRNEFVRSIESVREELIRNYENHGTTLYMVTDDLFNDSLEKVRAFHELFSSLPFRIGWSSFARLDMISRYPEMARLLKESGLKSVFFGLETFGRAAGLAVGKGLGPEKLKETLHHVREVWGEDVLISAGFIAGLPNEDEDSIRETFEWLLDPGCPIDVADYSVLCIQKPRDGRPEDGFVYSRIGEDSQKFDYTFDENGQWRTPQMTQMRASELVEAYFGDPRFMRKKRFAALTMHSRAHNLGYTFEDCRKLTYADEHVRRDMIARRSVKKNEYLTKLLR